MVFTLNFIVILLARKSLVDTLRYSANIRLGRTLGSKLENYFLSCSRNGYLNLLPKGTNSFSVSKIQRIGGGFWNDVFSISLSYSNGGLQQTRNLILKTYLENIDPVLQACIPHEDVRKCVIEFQVLTRLKDTGFSVPEPYLCECDSKAIGYPFIIMEKVELTQKSIEEMVDGFASTLANIHNLKVAELGIDVLRTPKHNQEFAEQWPINIKHYINLESKHSKKFKDDINLAIQWLSSNVSNNYCPEYSLVHGDYHPGNVGLTNDCRVIVLDWDSVEIGDPAFDVGYAYHFIKFFSNPKDPNSAEGIAERFVSEYKRNYHGDITQRLEFYKVVGILGTSIYYSSGLSNPLYAYKYHKRKVFPTFPFLGGLSVLLAFPFIRWPPVARQLFAEGDLLWLRYSESFLHENLKG